MTWTISIIMIWNYGQKEWKLGGGGKFCITVTIIQFGNYTYGNSCSEVI